MTPWARRWPILVPALAFGLMASACGLNQSPELLRVHGLGPDRLEAGDRVEIRGEGFAQGKVARVRLVGSAYGPDSKPRAVDHVVEGHATSTRSVEFTVDDTLEAAVCGADAWAPNALTGGGFEERGGAHPRHATLRGSVVVAFAAQTPGAPPVRGTLEGVVLDVFPRSRSASDVRMAREAGTRTLAFLGIPRVTATRYGLRVEELSVDGPALRAGLHTGDTITSFANVRVLSEADVVPTATERFATAEVLGTAGASKTFRFDLDGLHPTAPEPLRYAGFVLGSVAFLLLVWFLGGARLATWVEWRRAQANSPIRTRLPLSSRRRPRPRLSALHVSHAVALAVGIGLVLRPVLGRSFSSPSVDFLLCFGFVSLVYWLATLVVGGRRERGWSLSRGLGALGRALLVQLPGLLALVSLFVGTGSADVLALAGDQGAMPWQWRIGDSALACLGFGLWTFGAFAQPERLERVLGPSLRVRSGSWLEPFLLWMGDLHSQLVCAFGVVAFLGGWRIPGASAHSLTALAALVFALKVVLLGTLLEGLRRGFLPATPRSILPAATRFALPLALLALLLGTEARVFHAHPLGAWLENSVPPLLVVLPFLLLALVVAWRRTPRDGEGHVVNPWL